MSQSPKTQKTSDLETLASAQSGSTQKTIEAFIDEIIADANLDFQTLGMALRAYGESSRNDLGKDISQDVSLSVKELQRIDIFVQKLGHIRRLHEIITNGVSAETSITDLRLPRYRNIIYHLNYLQSAVAAFDYSTIVSTVTNHLDALQKNNFSTRTTGLQNPTYFRNRDLIMNSMNRLSVIFADHSKECPSLGSGLDPETCHALEQIRSIYSIESERFVLDWLLSNAQGTGEQLLQDYHTQHLCSEPQLVEGDIELF